MADAFVILTVISVFLLPVLGFALLILIPAAVGVSLGIRKLYLKVLLRVFEFATNRIQQHDSRQDLNGNRGEQLPDNNAAALKDKNSVALIQEEERTTLKKVRSFGTLRREFELSDCYHFCRQGIEAIADDSVTKCFSAAELPSWNLLTRTNTHYEFVSMRLTILWVIGFLFRYCCLLPMRFILTVVSVNIFLMTTAAIGLMPNSRHKRHVSKYVSLMCYRILARAFSAVVTYHNKENRAKGGICVANHTSPIDVIILACDACYAMVGQVHGGFTGMIQRAMSRSEAHIWFQRSESKDRQAVSNRLKEHVSDPDKLPILIFPEGTCINNTSVMMFKKGSFEVGGTIYPVAIKYDARFGDAFWNSSKYNMIQYLLHMMTSWAIVCDVWYLPPMHRKEGEYAVEFANRVKHEIAQKGGLVDLLWDGQLKRMTVKEDFKKEQQKEYSKLLKVE
ncbi:glycerol-3-phosphate acyltransferase 3-like isoform X1 [Branchiostoma floridae]|uniref:Glycerol-3-phosphate acyltransferase 3-like isoform X1 n=1 Tax=Branchiostoma floridae TaxID=7739 RepID=A0A9J7KXU6_BRAFL|nr:glycerol-3-phosphate acyltransferase 3-like isoform X1 [Branchiostoma floridae]